MGFKDRLAHAWNAFVNLDTQSSWDPTITYGNRPDRIRPSFLNERSVIAAIYTRIAIDVADLTIKHVRLDDKGRYFEDIQSDMNYCLTKQANLDQAATHFRQDMVQTLLHAGVMAVVPVDTTLNPNVTGGFDIKTMRVGTILSWAPTKIKVSVYNEQNGKREDIWLDKKFVAIVENPLYSVMNEPNSTLQRLIQKLSLLDTVDNKMGAAKLDLIVQLPYVIKSEARRQEAERRRKDIEVQLTGSQYGIAYTDGTERITQLNRPVDNNLLKQVEYLMGLLYSQLGITTAVMDGTASESEMLNYFLRTIKPIATAIVEAMYCKFLTKTARSQQQSIMFFRDIFAGVPIAVLAEVTDKFTRSEVLSSNEIRTGVGYTPSQDAKADQLRNSNMPEKDLGNSPPQPTSKPRLELAPQDVA